MRECTFLADEGAVAGRQLRRPSTALKGEAERLKT